MNGLGAALAWSSVQVTILAVTALVLERLAVAPRAARRVVGRGGVAITCHRSDSAGVQPAASILEPGSRVRHGSARLEVARISRVQASDQNDLRDFGFVPSCWARGNSLAQSVAAPDLASSLGARFDPAAAVCRAKNLVHPCARGNGVLSRSSVGGPLGSRETAAQKRRDQ